ncbi:Acyl-CoA synthetase (AMP-forming)/AMP-acid ligase II [Geosmithia morbida]|uniref:Acyl-CoA synthetase (AMP-forming)/AMP-acid ligase II n=1 Tax=Geosmithia morbida TaxID=1094350 RepID=A0A9P5D297_9HYPO|nr:Acyl-CoA synthetase (AMP-forming)/AMP-acid ligase II [Geosmithia morbida]KAF4120605.1 Acyl-CoA synthetase (AMP-forming)/AMP-acid ligase II [Geosmithia morbida]
MRAVALAAAEGAGLPMSNVVIISTDPLPRLESADKSTSWKYERETQALLPWRPITDPDELRTKTICLVYSSGTTGVPKGVRISHANMVAEVFLPATINRPIWDQWAVAGRPFETRTIAHLGTGHISGVQGYFVNAFFEGGIVYWMPQFDLATFLSSISALRITTFFSLPRIYAAITLNPATEAADLTSLRIAYSGGMPLDPRVYGSPKLRRAGHDSVLLSQTWGSTETTGAATHMPPDRYDDTGSVGILLPNVTMRLVDNNGNDVEPGQPGEAWLRGPIITQGYHRSPSNSRPVFSDGWYRTGDFIECRGDQLYVLGRLEDMIKYRDFLVPPAELEALLVQYPGVADVVVIGTSVEYDGISTQVPRALVSLQPGIEASDSLMEELAIYVNSKVPDHKKLRGGVKFISKVPRHVSGKLLRDQAQKL